MSTRMVPTGLAEAITAGRPHVCAECADVGRCGRVGLRGEGCDLFRPRAASALELMAAMFKAIQVQSDPLDEMVARWEGHMAGAESLSTGCVAD